MLTRLSSREILLNETKDLAGLTTWSLPVRKGTGLGLAIVSGILAAHRGNASLSKTKGGGLTVRIELPTT